MNARQPSRSPASKLKTVPINSIALLREGELGGSLAPGCDPSRSPADPSDDYPGYARRLGQAIQRGEADPGILIHASGTGASVAANKRMLMNQIDGRVRPQEWMSASLLSSGPGWTDR